MFQIFLKQCLYEFTKGRDCVTLARQIKLSASVHFISSQSQCQCFPYCCVLSVYFISGQGPCQWPSAETLLRGSKCLDLGSPVVT